MDGSDLPRQAGSFSRQLMLQAGAAAGGGLMLGLGVAPATEAAGAVFQPNAFIRISSDGAVTLIARAPDIGQGVRTSMPMLIAEDLEVDLSQVSVETADGDGARYGLQLVGGSSTIRIGYDAMRRAGAAGRDMLIAAAAQTWGAPANECAASLGVVTHGPTQRRLAYGALAAKAATLPAPDPATVRLKDAKDFRLIGKPTPNIDAEAIATGQPLFGIDVVVPGMLYAAYEKCPVFGGGAPVVANLDEVRGQPGVSHVFTVKGDGAVATMSGGLADGVAVVADSWWRADRARKLLKITWTTGPTDQQDSAYFDRRAAELAAAPPTTPLRSRGDVEAAFKGAAKVIEATYTYPFLTHATLEPQNCTASVQGDRVEIWAPTQAAIFVTQAVSHALNVPPENIIVHHTRAGGGFGRRVPADFAVEAARISREVGAPVKLVWTRADDMRHDYYRPGGYHNFKGGLGADGKLVGLSDHFVTFGAGDHALLWADMDGNEYPADLVDTFSYAYSLMPLDAPLGTMRAPRANALAFVFNGFVDELAHAAGKDPVAFNLELLGERRVIPALPSNMGIYAPPPFDTGRMIDVIKAVAARSGWGAGPLPAGHALGFAHWYAHSGYFAEVVEASVSADGAVTVHKVWVVGDVGSPIVNPLGADQQVTGAVIDGLSQALGQRLTLKDGAVVQGNFNEYRLMRITQAPARIDVQFLQTAHPPTGLGEPALPPVIPALVNAIFAATGKRIRTLPIDPAALKSA
jgi:isoquinoline 1-oxidoreductase beta subunit